MVNVVNTNAPAKVSLDAVDIEEVLLSGWRRNQLQGVGRCFHHTPSRTKTNSNTLDRLPGHGRYRPLEMASLEVQFWYSNFYQPR